MKLFGWSILHRWLHGRSVLFFAVFKHKAMFKACLRFPRISQASTRFGRIWAIQSDKTIDQNPSISVEKKGWGSKICLSIQVGIYRIYPKNHDISKLAVLNVRTRKGSKSKEFFADMSRKKTASIEDTSDRLFHSAAINIPVDVIPNCKLGQNVWG